MKTEPFSTETQKRVGIWIRVSTEEQAQGDSPEHHLERAKSYCAARGWVVQETTTSPVRAAKPSCNIRRPNA